MSTKLIGRNERGSKVYLGALSPQEIKEADEFLLCLQKDISTFEIELKNACSPSSLEYKYKIGEFLSNKIMSRGINNCERRYVWQEIGNWVETTIETSKDRGAKRQFYDYCFRLYSFGETLVFSFTWRQWSEFLDRSITTKDVRLLWWLKEKIGDMKEDDFRMFLFIMNEYLKNRDTTIFEQDELYAKYEYLFKIVKNWNLLLKEYFDGKIQNLSKARKNNPTKYKKKYVVNVLEKTRFNNQNIDLICRDVFQEVFVDVDTSGNFNLTKKIQ